MNAPAPRIALELTLEDGRTDFEPGARVTGVAAWSAPTAPRGMELRLSWAMHGRGGRDFKIADTISLPTPAAAERRPFILTLPDGPYSFRGRLVTLLWTLELVALPGERRRTSIWSWRPDTRRSFSARRDRLGACLTPAAASAARRSSSPAARPAAAEHSWPAW